MKQQVMEVLEREPGVIYSAQALMRELGVSKSDRADFKSILKTLCREGRIERLPGRSYRLAPPRKVLAGRVDATRSGSAFIILEGGGKQADIFIDRRNLGTAMDGDRVEIRLIGERRGRQEGVVERVLERRHTFLVGQYTRQRKGGVVVPRNQNIKRVVYIPRQYPPGEIPDDAWVQVKVTDWGEPHEPLTGEIAEVLGREGDKGLDVLLIVKDFGVEPEFPQDVLDEVAQFPEIRPQDIKGREDFREWITFTIDGDTAKDFDDALSLEKSRNGWRMGVHIADVSHYVKPGARLDAEAYDRATSIYPVDRVVPMLPERLSNELCSLRPDEDSLTMSVVFELDNEANVLDARVCNSIIHSNFRLTYSKVQRLLDGHAQDDDIAAFEPAHDAVRQLWKISEQLTKRRFERGAIDLDVPETEIILDQQGVVADVRRAERLNSMRLIEEFMLLSNDTVAQWLTDNQTPLLYRVHEPPNPDKVAAVAPLLALSGVVVPFNSKGGISQKGMQHALDKAATLPNGHILRYLVLRSMMQAKYSPENAGHFGLASPCYCHFTSPIRRYPDLVVHRMCKRLLALGKPDKEERRELEERLTTFGGWTSERERRAEKIERECVKIKSLEFMRQHIGEEFDGWITGMTPTGFFVELDRHPAEGMVRLDAIEDDYYDFIEEDLCMVGRRTGRRLRFGDPVRVMIEHIDLIALKMDLILLKAPKSASSRPAFATKKKAARNKGKKPARDKSNRKKNGRSNK
ncbi:ribonuclease R [Candidatus Sumerlaeota bacterium]|nr:ribonuclease R [Candidatus Sumerlaeota bacterium]